MLGFLSNRATAAHLALAAVAPLVLCKYLAADAVCAVSAWLALLAAVWAFASPVRREEEHAHDARRRCAGNLLADPFSWVAVAIVVYAAVISLNSGVGLAYDPEARAWRLAPPAIAALPGGIPGSGSPCICAAILTFVVYPAAVHTLDSRQSVYFAIVATVAVAVEAAFAGAAGFGVDGGSAVAYGLWSLVAAGAMFSAENSRRRPKELVCALALAGCVSALAFAGRPAVTAVFAAAIVLLALAFAALRCRELGFLGVVRAFLMMFVAFAIAAALFHWQSGAWETLVPDWSLPESDAILSRFAIGAWETSPWTGTGAGSFPIVAKLSATAGDWMALGPLPDFTRNAWRTLLVERGMVGLLVIAVSLGAMLYTWFRYARQRGLEHFAPAVPLLPIATGAVSALMFFDGSALHPEAIVAFVALAAFSVNGGQ